jgi:hypothetical protein
MIAELWTRHWWSDVQAPLNNTYIFVRNHWSHATRIDRRHAGLPRHRGCWCVGVGALMPDVRRVGPVNFRSTFASNHEASAGSLPQDMAHGMLLVAWFVGACEHNSLKICIDLTKCSHVFLFWYLILNQMVKTFLVFYGTRRFIIVFTKVRH